MSNPEHQNQDQNNQEIPKDSIILTNLSAHLPETVLTNEDLAADKAFQESQWAKKQGDTNLVEAVSYRTGGIEARHISGPNETSADLAVHAVTKLLEQVHLDPNKFTLVVVGSLSPAYRTPAISAETSKRTGMTKENGFGSDVIAFVDTMAACSSWIYSLDNIHAKLLRDGNMVAIAISTDTMSKFLKPDSRERILFGDGATAALVKRETVGDKGFRIIRTQVGGDATDIDRVKIPTAIAPEVVPQDTDTEEERLVKAAAIETFHLDAGDVYRSGVDYQVDFIQKYLKKNNLNLDDFDYIVPHQANGNMLDSLGERLAAESGLGPNKYGEDKILRNLESVGNTAASSIPLALHHFEQAKKFKNGDRILAISFGAGYTLGIVDFQYVA